MKKGRLCKALVRAMSQILYILASARWRKVHIEEVEAGLERGGVGGEWNGRCLERVELELSRMKMQGGVRAE